MRIGIMLRHLKQRRGGVLVATQGMLPEMLKLDTSHEFVLIYPDRESIGTFKGDHTRAVAVTAPSVFLWDQVCVPRVAKRERLDLIFNPKYSLPLPAKCRTVFTCHGLDWYVMPRGSRWIDRMNHRFLVPRYAKEANAIIAVSETTRQHVLQYWKVSEDRVHTVYHGIDEAFRMPVSADQLVVVRHAYNLPERFFLYCGQVYPPKNFGRLLQAYAQVGPALGISLVVAGGQHLWLCEEELALIDRLNLTRWVVQPGWVERDRMPALYAMAEALLMPSLYESFGIPILESMATGCAVVTSNRYGTAEVAGGAAMLVDPEDVQSIAEGIHRVVRDQELRQQLITAGRKRASGFSWKKCAQETLQVLEEVLSGETLLKTRATTHRRLEGAAGLGTPTAGVSRSLGWPGRQLESNSRFGSVPAKERNNTMRRPISREARMTSRICLLADTFYPTVEDGIAMHGYQLARGLSLRGVELIVITRQMVPELPRFERVGNIEILRVPPCGQFSGKGWQALGPVSLHALRALYLLIVNANRYDTIVVCGVKVFSWPALLLKLVAAKKCVFRSESPMEFKEDFSPQSMQKMKLARFRVPLALLRNLRNRILKQADCFVPISSEIRDELLRLGWKPEKIRSIPNGIDTDLFCPVSSSDKLRIRQKLGLPLDRTLFVYTGRLATSKGVLLLIRVWKELRQKYKDIHLVLVGSGAKSFSIDSCEEELADFVREHKLENTVSLTGQVDNVHEYLQAADAFVFPSEYEGFGLSILEALAAGLPSVVTRVGVASDHIQDYNNGILVNPKDQAAMLQALTWMLEHKGLWPSIGKNARKGVAEKYSIAVEAESYVQILKELHSGPQEGPS